MLKVRKDPFDLPPHLSLASVVAPIPAAELDVARTLLHHAVADSLPAHPSFVGFGIVGLVSINVLGVCGRNPLEVMGLLSAGCTNESRANQLMLPVAADVGFVTVIAPMVVTRVAGIRIGGSAFGHRLELRTF